MRAILLAICCWLLVAACSRDLVPATAGPLDSAFRAAGLPARKVKFTGPVTIQLGGTGNTAQAQDLRKAGQHGGALATSPGASAGATTRTGVPTWQLVAGGVFLLLLLLTCLAYKFRDKLLRIGL